LAFARAINREKRKDLLLLRKAVHIIAGEARAVGINIVFSPVLDVNTNPENPIICTRAFGDDPERVAWFGREFIKGFHREGIIACGKHFPGHGDTSSDSHRELPVVEGDIKRLAKTELYPFQQAIRAGVKMIMVGHLKVPALDTRFPSSLSQKTIQGLLRGKMKFQGLVVTDAMNMHAVSKYNSIPGRKKQISEGKACLQALQAGADILLHPKDPERVIEYLDSERDRAKPAVARAFQRITRAKRALRRTLPLPISINRIGSKANREVARELTQRSIRVRYGNENERVKRIPENPVLLLLDDDNSGSGSVFSKNIQDYFPSAKLLYIDNAYQGGVGKVLDAVADRTLIIGVFSKVSAWKGRSGLTGKLFTILKRTIRVAGYSVVVGFCCPSVLLGLGSDIIVEAYSGEGLSQESAVETLHAL
jgi:beta-glucosidase-like glycosyl hydrolase